MNSYVLLDKKGPVATLTLNRSNRHNSLIPELLEQLLSALDEISDSPEMRVVILQANGRSFSTGGDLLEFYNHREEIAAYAMHLVSLLNNVILALIELPVPVVAAVHGIVTGGSLGLVLASDIVIATPETSFTPYYGVVGFSPDGGWTAILPSIIGPKRVAEILLCNRTITADDAVNWGLVNKIVLSNHIRREAMDTARETIKMEPRSLKSSKQLLLSSNYNLVSRLDEELTRFINQVQSEEAMKRMIRFLEID